VFANAWTAIFSLRGTGGRTDEIAVTSVIAHDGMLDLTLYSTSSTSLLTTCNDMPAAAAAAALQRSPKGPSSCLHAHQYHALHLASCANADNTPHCRHKPIVWRCCANECGSSSNSAGHKQRDLAADAVRPGSEKTRFCDAEGAGCNMLLTLEGQGPWPMRSKQAPERPNLAVQRWQAVSGN
jgi:hypothetical protein